MALRYPVDLMTCIMRVEEDGKKQNREIGIELEIIQNRKSESFEMKTLRKRAKWIITEEERKIRSERMKRV